MTNALDEGLSRLSYLALPASLLLHLLIHRSNITIVEIHVFSHTTVMDNKRSPSPAIPMDSSDSSDTEKRTPTESANKVPPPPPDGGLTAWLQVVGAFFLFFNSW